jgi:predicted ATPase/class 3 adenylate cyclase
VPISDLPTGRVTFLFTDIEGSTRLLESLGDRYVGVLERHHSLMRASVTDQGGIVVGTEGDAFFAVFRSAEAAVRAAAAAQRALAAAEWPADHPVRVRMGLHTGEGTLGGDDYVGLDVHRAARIAAAAHGGQVLVSRATVEAVGDHPGDELALRSLGEHRLKDLSRAEHLHQLCGPGLQPTFPPPRTLSAVPNNLPVELTSFVGRTEELARIRELLREGARLVTLLGPGGTGKTRLALQVAGDLVDRYRDGVTFVDLSALRDPSLVPAAIAEPLGIIDAPGRSIEDRIVDHLRDREALLVIDNFEQVIDAAPVVAGIVRGAPRVVVLVTSRAPLRLSGERELSVEPLPLPDPSAPPGRLAANDAVALFVERAAAVRPGFALDAENAGSIARICERLDGMPLAIELAAARTRLLTPKAILTRLDRVLEVLSAGARDLPERQRTLAATIAWSHDLLEPAARRVFARFSVFEGGASLEAAERVCGPDDELDRPVLDALSELVDQSLLRQVEAEAEPRLTMLGTIRAYAAEQLAPEDAGPVADRHAQLFVELAETAAPELLGVERRTWLDRLTLEHDNLRAAFDRGIHMGATEPTARLAAALWRFWQMRGHLVEGRDRLTEALELPDLEAHPDAHARLLTAMGGIDYWLGDATGSGQAYRRAFELVDGTTDPPLRVEVLTNAAMTIDEEASMAFGTPAHQKLFGERRAMLDEALDLARRSGDQRGEATVLWSIGLMHEWTGDLAEARRSLADSAAVARRCGDHFHSSWAVSMLASVALAEGDLEAARDLAREGLREFALVGDLSGIMLSLAAIAGIEEARGDSVAAMRLHGAAAAFAEQNGSRYLSMERDMRGQDDPAERARADPIAREAFEAGRAMSLDEAVALALGDDPPA